jgi:preprotein translocase subunit SecG
MWQCDNSGDNHGDVVIVVIVVIVVTVVIVIEVTRDGSGDSGNSGDSGDGIALSMKRAMTITFLDYHHW